MLDDLGNTAGVEMPGFTFLATSGEKGGIGQHVVFGSLNLRIKVSFDLEYLPEVFIVHRQQLVEQGVTGKHHLHLYRHRFRSQPLGRDEPRLLKWVFYSHLSILNRPLKRWPDAGIREHIVDTEQHIATVGLTESACFQHGMVTDVPPEEESPLNLAEYIAEIGITLENHRRTFGSVVIHKDVYLERKERISSSHGLTHRDSEHGMYWFFSSLEGFEVVEYISFEAGKILSYLRPIRVSLKQRAE